VPVSVVAIFVAATAIPASAQRTKPVIDYGGIVFVGLGAAGLTLATDWGGTLYPWASGPIVGLFAGSAVALGIFVWVESRAAAPILPIRLFARPIFTVSCVLTFVVGFAMLGALTFLPTYMQYVDGVSATTSGLRLLPMVLGMLITSTGSGTLVGRTGRYKIVTVVGTALLAVAFLLMSTMHAGTPALLQSVYLMILGTGLGSMHVLVIVVQNTADYDDLGVVTSGVKFFGRVGSSFGAAIFGSLFVNFLHPRMAAALKASGVTPEAVSSPKALHRLPDATAAPVVAAYAESLAQVFFWAVPVAGIGLILGLCLREVPLRNIRSKAVDLGDGFGMPGSESSEKLMEIAIGRVLRAAPGMRLRSVVARPDCELDVAGLWVVLRIHRYAQIFGTARLTDIAEHVEMPYEVLEPAFDRLVETGYAVRDGDEMGLTVTGERQVHFVSTLLLEWVVDKLAGSPSFQGRPDRHAVEAALERIAHRVLSQHDWHEDRPRSVSAASGVAGRTISPP
jgi:hypothetical protein